MTDHEKPSAAEEQEDFLFSGEDYQEPEEKKDRKTWKIVIADDEPDVHNITKMVLTDYTFEGRGLEFLNAYSGAEAKRMVDQNPDAAIILLDVVMETDDSGLEVARFIRKKLKNDFIRIVLRTGQPGKAPEREIITRFDINDYKEKTELTAQKLFTTITSSLRAYRDLRIIEKNRRGLEQIIESSACLFELQSLKNFARGALTQLLSILKLDESSLYIEADGFTASKENGCYRILAATGQFADAIDQDIRQALPEVVMEHLTRAMNDKRSLYIEDAFVGYFPTSSGHQNLLYIRGCKHLTDLDKDLIRIFSTNVAIAFENIYLNKELVDTQKEMILTLGDVLESRSKEAGNHVRRVAEASHLLARKAGLSSKEAELLRLASPMHDLGKVGVADSILFKADSLSEEEFEMVKAHTRIGHEILKGSTREICQAAALVALQHHERWDGKGYPQGLKKEEIHIFGRITGIMDVFDALTHKRIYKKAWPLDRVIGLIQEERGRYFDPTLVDIFLENLDEFVAINEAYPDVEMPECTGPTIPTV